MLLYIFEDSMCHLRITEGFLPRSLEDPYRGPLFASSRSLFASLIVRLIPENQVRLPCSSTCFVLTKPDGEGMLNLLNVDEI